MRRTVKYSLFIAVLAMTLLLGACGNAEIESISSMETNEAKGPETVEGNSNYLCEEITDNMKLDLELPDVQRQSGKTYKVSGRNFDIEEAAQLWNLDLSNANYYVNELSGTEFFEGADGWEISGGNGDFMYYDREAIYEAVGYIKIAYEEELKDFSMQDIAGVEANESVLFAKDVLEKIYIPESNEVIVLTNAIRVQTDRLYEYQEELVRQGVAVGTGKTDMHLFSDNLDENTYYLSFGVMLDGIKEADQGDRYGFKVADMDANTSRLIIDMIVEGDRVSYLYISDAFVKQELEENSLISIQDAINVLKAKYELEIIPEEQIISEAYLEYVFVDDAESNDEYEGKLMPYWCFNNETSLCSDRINAVTGDDFQYE